MRIRIQQFVCLAGVILTLACGAIAQQDSTRLEDLLKNDIFKKNRPPVKKPQTQPAKPAIDEPQDDTLLPPVRTDDLEKTDKRDFDAKADADAIPAIPRVPDIPEMPNSSAKSVNQQTNKPIALRRDGFNKRIVPITMSRKDRVQKRNVPLNMLPENAAVTGRLGRISKTSDGWYVVDYVKSPELKPLARQRLLPCGNLESAIEILKKEPNAVFGIYGQAMVFNDTPYLLLRRLTRPDDSDANRAELDLAPAKKEETEDIESGQDKPAYEGEETGEIMAELLAENKGAGITTAFAPKVSASENVKSVAPAGKTPFSRGRENLVIDRIARVVKPANSKWYQAHFESDNTLREPPYMILPNSKLQEAVRINHELGRSGTKYRISGEITYFQGQRYLLITKIFLQRDMRQF